MPAHGKGGHMNHYDEAQLILSGMTAIAFLALLAVTAWRGK
jgi:hypothetical protein